MGSISDVALLNEESGKSDIFSDKRGRVIITAPSSGSGKTLVTCALIRMLTRHGVRVSAFKCGPDFIDPMFHREVLGVPSRNLDLFLAGRDGVLAALDTAERDNRLSVIEGVMGYYDGMGADSMEGSTYETAAVSKTPAVLVCDARGMSRSILPLLSGFVNYQEKSCIRGVILNRIAPSIYPAIKKRIEEELDIPVLGYLPRLKDVSWQSRHLGLIEPGEIDDLLAGVDRAADALEKGFDFETFFEIAHAAQEEKPSPDMGATTGKNKIKTETLKLNMNSVNIGSEITENMTSAAVQKYCNRSGFGKGENQPEFIVKMKTKIAVARDAAFSFYYEDNLRLLEKCGAEICFFSPLADKILPEGTRGILLGGGYPELYARELSENRTMLKDIRRAAENGMPCLAECGGFLYLMRSLTDSSGRAFPMAGVLDGDGFMTGKLVRFGYVDVETLRDTPFLPGGAHIRAHEFHYADATNNGDACLEIKPVSGRLWRCMVSRKNIFAGFPHFYYPSCPELVKNFVEKCGQTAERPTAI